MGLTVNLFGKPQILFDDTVIDITVGKAVALVAYLIATDTAHSRERLATLFWPESKGDVARTSLRQVIQALKRTPIASALSANGKSVKLADSVQSDVKTFRNYFQHSDCTNMHPSLDAIARLQKLESLYKGDFLQDFSITGSLEWDDWQGLQRITFEYQATCVIAALARYYVSQGLVDSGLNMTMRWLEMEPLSEEAHHLTMQLYMLNQQAERALEQYHFLTRLLDREYGRDPDPDIQQTYDRIRNGQFVSTTPEIPNKRSDIRNLLPKPTHEALQYDRVLTTFFDRLKMEYERPDLLVVYDSSGQQASDFIAALAHHSAVPTCFPDGVLWAFMHSSDNLEAIVRLWLDAMRVSILKSTSNVEHLIWQFHSAQRDKHLVFLLENVEDPEQARLLTPGYPGCTLIITTSRSHVAAALKQEADSFFSLPLDDGG